ncbi:hypothetical protein BV898_08502 [Hypsibius exemplaris]|uniref:Otopetrin-2 n=1 Tax=Hypsibius exemplaris TaxID=2072580 RepID=A0A1W0WQD6_HYPEX|nr:hypothetical protein BV898_08502 [Hypsibius exemplaris]
MSHKIGPEEVADWSLANMEMMQRKHPTEFLVNNLEVVLTSEPSSTEESTHPEETKVEHKRTEISKDISAMYGLVAIVLAVCIIPISENTESFNKEALRWYATVNLVLAISFLIFCFAFLFRPPKPVTVYAPSGELTESSSMFDVYSLRFRQLVGKASRSKEVCIQIQTRQHVSEQELDSGSLYLKVGSMIFGVGTLVYLCLTFGVFVENYECLKASIVLGVNPILQIIFVMLQLLFIFRNSRFTLKKYRTIGRLGIMHMVIMDVIISFRTLMIETIHEFMEINRSHEESTTLRLEHLPSSLNHHKLEKRSVTENRTVETGALAYLTKCQEGKGVLVQSALYSSKLFLYPCVVEYALICAGILLTMWRGLSDSSHLTSNIEKPKKTAKLSLRVRARTAFRINCDQAVGGLFAGLLVFVLVLVALILFFISFDNKIHAQKDNGVTNWLITDIGLNGLGLVAVSYCFFQFIRKLGRFEVHLINLELDESLLMIGMIGVYAYAILSLLGTFDTADTFFGRLSQASSSLILLQATVQTLFLLDAGKRGLKKDDLERKSKPGKQALTFLLVLNFAMWTVDVFCAVHPDGTPQQHQFYGAYAWTLLLHLTVPLMIFYRFHSTACIFEVWKRAYKEPKEHSAV